MSDTPTQHDFDKLYEKLEEVAKQQGALKTALEVHVATETQWQTTMSDKIDNHVTEHQAASNIWRKGVVGMFFMLVGTLIVWASSFIWQHKGS